MTKLKKYFFLLLLLELFFSYAPAYAQSTPVYNPGVDKQIQQYLCAPPANGADSGSSALFTCINNLYKFCIVLASVIGVFFIVIAGYIWMSADGNQESITKAKGILTSTITALVLLLGGFVFLKALNPDIIQFQPIVLPTAPAVAPITATTPTTGGAGNTPSGTCSGCVNLAGAGIPTQNSSISVNSTVAAKLQTLKSQPALNGVNWQVSSGYDYRPTPTDCHNSGACVDVVVVPGSDANWSSLCSAAKAAGFSTILNEASQTASQCPQYQTYSTTDGANIHLVP